MGGLGTIVEDMTEVRVALRARNRSTFHTQRGVAYLRNILGGDRRPETRPACARFKLRRRIEQRVVTADTAVDPFTVFLPVFSGEGDFSIRVARDVENALWKLLVPLGRGLDHLGDACLPQALAC